jgi:hypothetical protein
MAVKRVKVKKVSKAKGKVIKVKRKSKVSANTNKTSVRINLPGVPSSGFGGASSSSAGGGGSTTVVLPQASGPQPSGAYDTYGNDFNMLKRDGVAASLTAGFQSLFEQFANSDRGNRFSAPKPTVTEVVAPREGVQPDNVIPLDGSATSATGFDMSNMSNAGPVDGSIVDRTAVPNQNQPQGLVAPNVVLSDSNMQQREQAMNNRNAENADRLYQQQTAVVDRMEVADTISPYNGVPTGQLDDPQLRLQKRKPVQVNATLAREARDFINYSAADAILNRGQDARFMNNQFNGAAALGIYENQPSNNRFEKASRLDAAGNSFELQQPRFPALTGQPARPQIEGAAQEALIRYQADEDDF